MSEKNNKEVNRILHKTTITLRDKKEVYIVQRTGNEWTITNHKNGFNLSLTKSNLEAILNLEG